MESQWQMMEAAEAAPSLMSFGAPPMPSVPKPNTGPAGKGEVVTGFTSLPCITKPAER